MLGPLSSGTGVRNDSYRRETPEHLTFHFCASIGLRSFHRKVNLQVMSIGTRVELNQPFIGAQRLVTGNEFVALMALSIEQGGPSRW